MKEIKIFRRNKEIVTSEKKAEMEEYWHTILNPYTSKPRFKNFLNKDRNDVKHVLKSIYARD